MPKYMDIQEFRDLGYLHELNRGFLHPHGLALEVVEEEDGTVRLGGIWDYRDDPEGLIFGEDTLSPEKAMSVATVAEERRPLREAGLGFWIQPIR